MSSSQPQEPSEKSSPQSLEEHTSKHYPFPDHSTQLEPPSARESHLKHGKIKTFKKEIEKSQPRTVHCISKFFNGFGLGLLSGVTFGFIFGTYGARKMGWRGIPMIRATSKSIFATGITFGAFFAIGNTLTCGRGSVNKWDK